MPPPTPVDTTIADVVAHAARRADPTFAERERLGVVVDPHGQPGVRGEPRPQREAAPRGDVERRDVLAAASIGPPQPTPTATASRRVEPSRRAAASVAKSASASASSGVGASTPRDERAVVAHDADRELGAADVDAQ